MGKAPTHGSRPWSSKEDKALRKAVKRLGKDWTAVREAMDNRRSESALEKRYGVYKLKQKRDKQLKKSSSSSLSFPLSL
jgi:hypothetical protein